MMMMMMMCGVVVCGIFTWLPSVTSPQDGTMSPA